MSSQKKDLLASLDHLIIELAWSDKVSFEAIEQQTGKNEKQVIELMRKHLKELHLNGIFGILLPSKTVKH